jgi:hypothetical protein
VGRELLRRVVLVVTPLVAAVAVLTIGLFAAVACFGGGSAALVALGRPEAD